MMNYRPRRTMLYVPVHVQSYLVKARTLAADSVIYDLQESVPPQQKDSARALLAEELGQQRESHSERVVRINPLYSEWGMADLNAIVNSDIDAILLPRVESPTELLEAIGLIDSLRKDTSLDIMVNIESPLGVLRSESICAASNRVTAVILGTTDLANELKITQTQDRAGLLTSLSLVILAARAHKKCVVDGPHFDLKNVEACEFSCRQARDLGFDGKTVVHPIQLDYTNDAFTPKRVDIERAKLIISAINEANEAGRNVAVLDDRLIEPSLKEWAERVISLYNTVKELGQNELLGSRR